MVDDAREASESSENTEKINRTEAERKWCSLPKTVQELLCAPPLLPHEAEHGFLKLFYSFWDYAKPENEIEYHLVYTATVSKWETQRYRSMAVAITENQQQAGLKSLFMKKSDPGNGPLLELTASMEAAEKAKRCVADSNVLEEAYYDLELHGYVPMGEPFLLSLPALSTIERLLASAEKRFAATIKELEKRIAARPTGKIAD